MGIEPTNHSSHGGSTGFEDQARHQTRRTSTGLSPEYTLADPDHSYDYCRRDTFFLLVVVVVGTVEIVIWQLNILKTINYTHVDLVDRP